RTARVGMAALACFIALGVVAWATPSDAPAAATDDAAGRQPPDASRMPASGRHYRIHSKD
ncbi:hypothetical protein, partial [Stenotrophomonas maltophilia group sp. RNC7]|uniref:hypothetical protein n=1 Tax=Stenotrophomonas maltophilia group sp. RNC7 TaxID=3071467 RepID=UPI0027E0E07D